MNNISVLVLFCALLGSGYSKSLDLPDSRDLREALTFIECTRKAILTGIPEADIPTHNPLKLANVSVNFPLGLSSVTLNLTNIEMNGIPQWNVTEASQAVTEDPNVEDFKFIIYWPLMSFSLDWEYTSKSLLNEDTNSGTLYVELDHVNFDFKWISTKPNSSKNGTLDDLSLKVSTREAQINVTNLGEVGDVINAVGGPIVAFAFNNTVSASEAGKSLKERLITEWIDKPERIDAINANCNK